MPDYLGYLSFEQFKLEQLEAALQFEADGKALKRDLGARLAEAVEPALPIVRSELMAMGGDMGVSPPLRAAVSNALTIKVRYSGAAPGVRVAISRRGMPRGFQDAARRINQGEWSHPVYGRGSVTQTGRKGFFDNTLNDRREEMREAIEKALQDMAERISKRA